jgi:hypothetical protein
MHARMIAFYSVGMSMKTLRNALFVDSSDSIIEKMMVMRRIATEQRTCLNRDFVTFLSFFISSTGLQTKKSQNCCD